MEWIRETRRALLRIQRIMRQESPRNISKLTEAVSRFLSSFRRFQRNADLLGAMMEEHVLDREGSDPQLRADHERGRRDQVQGHRIASGWLADMAELLEAEASEIERAREDIPHFREAKLRLEADPNADLGSLTPQRELLGDITIEDLDLLPAHIAEKAALARSCADECRKAADEFLDSAVRAVVERRRPT